MKNICDEINKNKRDFARVQTLLSIKIRVVPPIEKLYLKSRVEGNPQMLQNTPQVIGDPGLNEWMQILDAKLDFILNLLNERHASAEMPTEVCELSAGGMNIISSDRFSVGDILELKILYPFSPPQILVLYGQVLRSDVKIEEGFLTAIKFTVIDDQVKDRIIRLVFEKERETIRRKREE
jgi:hypothetical protein